MGDFRTTYLTGTRGRALSLHRARRAGSLVLAGALAFTLAAAPVTVPAPAFAASAAASLPATVQNAAYAKADATQAADIAAIEQSYAEKFGAQAAGTKALSDYLAGRDVATDSFMKIDASWLSSACAGKSAYAQALAKDVAAQHAKIAKLQAQADQSASSSTSSSSSSTTQGAGSSTASSASSSVSSSASSAAAQPPASASAAPDAAPAAPADQSAATPAPEAAAPVSPTTTGGAEYIRGSIKPNQTTQAFIDSIKDDAQVIAQDHDLYGSVMIAQAVLESGSGSSGLSAHYNNLFGIKGSYQGMSVTLPTQEDDGAGNVYTVSATFRAYPSARDSLLDYADLLGTRFYAPAHKSATSSYVEACDYLQGRYATSTTYSAQLQDVISAYNLTQYDDPAAATDATQDAAAADAAASASLRASGLFDADGMVPLTAMLPLDGASAPTAAAEAGGAPAPSIPGAIVALIAAGAAAAALALLVWINPGWMQRLEPYVFGALVRVRRALRALGSHHAPDTAAEAPSR